ncbi:MAG: [protein-PII] uridylyltransferase [Ilumatobacteraceae bacterium]|jgi:[protein-PII] uridylyltransferase|nr:[protein-PII] uridylyltransferase [Acidimicrobiaceae bacterium]MBP6487013.1 [protein-PII] uridylyltransferase [Ilumatobacteraceae bacterium]MBK9969636.1 [protein-PII] uridylyltransferase [Acidimicrobiaceae bacterium]MBP7890660.1 [protein-PII] uridylyltransferase [Ilumatobacteraceae bacterium]MBP8209419.1 [protein-PII] uridylyltransferase [Ilumatobacteraceae bacterium]
MKPVDAATIKRVRSALVADEALAGRGLARRLSQHTDSWFESLAGELPAEWAVIATGGYARGVLAPGSDIDVVLLHPPKAKESLVKEMAEALWYPLWDAGLKLSPAVHSVKSLLQLAGDDLDTATSVLTVRPLAGDPHVAAEVQRAALEQWRRRPFVWLQRLLENGHQRWKRFGDVASLLEPDLKDGRGGLRDHDMIRWALRVDRSDVAAALEAPIEDLAGPADLLLAVRCELHRTTGRATNMLLLQDQDRVAAAMGYADADALMLQVAGSAHAIEWAADRFWRRIERLIRTGGRATSGTRVSATLAPGIVVIDEEAGVADGADLDSPSFVFRFAAAAAHAGLPLDGRSLRMLASRGVAPGEAWTENTLRAFVSLLGAGRAVVPTVEALERYDLFSRYLPEWRAVRSLPQRNAFHTFTVDHHLLETVANASAFVRDVGRPDLLLLGALMHDLGKGHPGDHTDAGVRLIDDVAARMGLPDDDREVVRSMVALHLLLPETATRRDLSDPRTAQVVAEAVGDLGTLQLLRALTEADSKATGPAAWSAWKQSLLDELVTAAAGVLRGQESMSRTAPVARHLERLAALVSDVPGAVHTEHEDLGDVEVLRTASRDRTGLFATIAGVLALHGLDVVNAAAATSADEVAVDEFRISKSAGVTPNWQRIENDLRGAVSGDVDIASRLEQRLRSASRRRPQAAASPRFEVLVSNEASESTTVIEVRAPDAPAVLYRLSHALTGMGLDVRAAMVATLGHEVVDVFYVKTSKSPDGRIAEGDFEQVRADLKSALAG